MAYLIAYRGFGRVQFHCGNAVYTPSVPSWSYYLDRATLFDTRKAAQDRADARGYHVRGYAVVNDQEELAALILAGPDTE